MLLNQISANYDCNEEFTCLAVQLTMMVNPRIELPPAEELAEWLRKTRRKHNITQTDLAQRTEMSPSQISRLEGQSGGTAYKNMYRIQRELLTMIAEETEPRVEDLLKKKREEVGEDYDFQFVSPKDSVESAVDDMEELKISQLPVLTNNKESVGRLTEHDLMTAEDREAPVKQRMRAPLPEIPTDTPVSIARDLLEENEALLITPSKETTIDSNDDSYVGILTPADLARDFEKVH